MGLMKELEVVDWHALLVFSFPLRPGGELLLRIISFIEDL